MKRESLRSAVICSLVAASFALPAFAHHSFAATYDEGKTVTVDGKVAEFLFRNPHCLFSIDTTDSQGNATKWSVEWFGAGRLGRSGVNQGTFQTGDHVILTGSPGKYAEDHRLHLKTIVRPSDGLKFDNRAVYRR